MSYTNQTVHYGLPLPTQTDLVNGLDNNDAFERVDAALYGAEQAATNATRDISAIRATVAQLENADVQFQSDLTGVTARVATLEQNETEVVEDIQDTQDMITAREVANAQSDVRILVGEWFRYNGVLYKCTVQIEVGDTIVPNVNCAATNVETEVRSGGTVSVTAASVSFDDAVAQIGETNVQDALVALKTMIDNLGGGSVNITRQIVNAGNVSASGYANIVVNFDKTYDLSKTLFRLSDYPNISPTADSPNTSYNRINSIVEVTSNSVTINFRNSENSTTYLSTILEIIEFE